MSRSKSKDRTLTRATSSASPRPGGYLKSTESLRSQQPTRSQLTFSDSLSRAHPEPVMFTTESFYSVPREHRIGHALEESGWKTKLEESEADLYTIEVPSPAELADNMLAVVISSVMIMASKVSKIPNEYLDWTEDYLSCIRDGMDNHPPNVQGILNHIRYLRSKKASKSETKSEASSQCLCECESNKGGSVKPVDSIQRAGVAECSGIKTKSVYHR